ncbi:MAG: cytochrome c [Deinococcales bacterium]
MAGRFLLTLASLVGLALATAVAAQSTPDGATLYDAHCAVCHQADGSGITAPPTFPPLDGEVGRVAAAGEGGRQALIDVVLFGIKGDLTVDGVSYAYGQEMPGWRKILSDEEIASLLNHVLASWSNPDALAAASASVSAKQVADERARELSPEHVYARWQKVTP